MAEPRVLILGGTAEAVELAARLAGAGRRVVTSLAGRTSAPRAPAGEVRLGGFGGAAGLEAFLRAEGIAAVIDATHPFAARIGRHAEAACSTLGVPRLRLLRPPWQAQAGDRWHSAADPAAAARRAAALGRVLLVTTGQRELGCFLTLAGCALVVRTIEPPAAALPPQVTWLQARGPFTLADELALFTRHGIEVLVTKASGGEATYAKLAAARALALPVVMICRPPPPPGPEAGTVEAAIAWLEEICRS